MADSYESRIADPRLTSSRDISFWDQNDPKWKGYRPGVDQNISNADVEAQWAPYNAETDPAVQARRFLDNPSLPRSGAAPTQEDIDYAKRVTTAPPRATSLRDLTEAAKMGGSLGFEAVEQNSKSPVLRTAAGYGKYMLPTYAPALALSGIRKLIAPEQQTEFHLSGDEQGPLPDTSESRWEGAGELGMAAAGPIARAAKPFVAPLVAPIGRAVGGAVKWGLGAVGKFGAEHEAHLLANLGREAREAARVGGNARFSKEVPGFGGVGENVSNFGEQVAQKLPESWKQFVRPASFRGKAEKAASYVKPDRNLTPKLAEKLRASGLDESSFGGERTVGSSSNPLLDLLPESGLGTVTPAEWRKLGLRQVSEHFPSYTKAGPAPETDWGENLLANLSRLKIPARARAFATNTPLPE